MNAGQEFLKIRKRIVDQNLTSGFFLLAALDLDLLEAVGFTPLTTVCLDLVVLAAVPSDLDTDAEGAVEADVKLTPCLFFLAVLLDLAPHFAVVFT